MRLWKISVGFVLSFGLLGALSCTREAKEQSVKIRIPVASSVGGLAAYNLEVAIVNVHVPGKPLPIVSQLDTDKPGAAEIPFGQALEMEIPNVPAGSGFLIQFLGVYRGDGAGDLKFYYGDRVADVSGTTVVDITATASGTSSGKEAEIAGRYLTGSNTGPTGNLILYFDMNNGKPAMAVDRVPIVNGWFQGFAVQGAYFDFVVAETQAKIFDDLTLDAAGNLQHRVSGGLTNISGNLQRLIMLQPAGFRREDDGMEPVPETRLVLGFFDNASDSYTSGKKVFYASSQQGVPSLYSDAALTQLMDYTGVSGTGIRNNSGGTSATFDQLFTLTGMSGCTQTDLDNGNCLRFFHTRLGFSGREGYSGMEGPFRLLRPFVRHGGFVSVKFNDTGGCSSTHCIDLKWSLLPHAGAGLSEIEVWRKLSSGGDGGEYDRSCAELGGLGYVKVGSVTTPSSQDTFQNQDAAFTAGNWYNYRYALCPRGLATLGAHYLGRPVYAECGSGCGQIEHFGWALSSADGTVSSLQTHPAGRRVSAVDATTSPHYTSVTFTSSYTTSEFSAGDEVMIHVSGMRGSNTCGAQAGPGSYDFARVIWANTGTILKISKGSLVDRLETVSGANLTTASNSGSSFCYVQVVKVVHYNDLTLNATATYTAPAFTYGDSAGGILALRVSGALIFGGNNASLSVAGRGYAGGNVTLAGDGTSAAGSSGASTGTGGAGGTVTDLPGSGGGSAGSGGRYSASSGNPGFGSNSGGGMFPLAFGGGGGGHYSSGAGGPGGGILFVMANKIQVNGTGVEISALGGDLSGGGGNGAGGSIFVMARKTAGGNPLLIASDAGSGATGGKGGGGYVTDLICANDTANPVTVTRSALRSSTGADALNEAQNGIISTWNPANHLYLCSDL